jgi:hypothetical protein
LTSIPQAFLNAVGVFPIFGKRKAQSNRELTIATKLSLPLNLVANAYIYFGAIYAAWSCTFFQQKMRRTVKWQSAAIACYHWGRFIMYHDAREPLLRPVEFLQ